MLTKDLLLVEVRRDKVRPKYLYDSELAKILISLFKENLGNRVNELKRQIKKIERGRTDYKVVRALAELVQRTCKFVPSTDLDILHIRRALFAKGFVVDEEKRDSIFEIVAEDFGVSKEDLENAMFADLPEEQVLTQIDVPTPEDLMRKYNLSLTQALLFNATEMVFTVGENYQQIFRTINYLGLMYETDGTELRVNGPVSLLKNTKKYGTSLAKLIPSIIQSDNWSLKVKIKMERGNEPRIFTFTLNSKENVPFPRFKKKIIEFDSKTEEQFYKDFVLYAPDWEIKREPTFIKAGNYVIIPDFGFYKSGITIFLEVVGFWTPEYLQKKIKKFNETDTMIIAAVNQNLKWSRADFPGDVIFYEKNIPIKTILDILKREEEKNIEMEIVFTQTIELDEDIADLKTQAKLLNISQQALEQIEIPDYFIIGEKLVSKKFLEKLKKEIGGKRKFSEIKQILDKYQLTDKALELIGYKIVWKGLIPSKIIKKTKSSE
ncbi:MAG: DUF790 family protein [Promethearchaeota archaeon]|nr:MAG: DUF790 family protein [Candidatus Lokiarchaeota archaeon]